MSIINRSKNLDVLFKREYYEQRIRSECLKSSVSSGSLEVEPEVNCDTKENQRSDEIRHDTSDKDLTENTFGNIDPDSIPEFKPMESPASNSPFDSEEPFPYYINHLPNDTPLSLEYDPVVHPTLYLFSPATNTLIPCQQIIIPNSNAVSGGSPAVFLAYNGQEITQLSPNLALESGKSR